MCLKSAKHCALLLPGLARILPGLSHIFLIFLSQDAWTALHFATEKGHKDVVSKLLESGADLKVKTKV